MARKKDGGHGGGHGWFVTFADLMGLLLAYFVMLVAFSQPKSKEMAIMAGSIRDAFGVQRVTRASGMIDIEGAAPRKNLVNIAKITPNLAGTLGVPKKDIQQDTMGEGTFMADRAFTTAAESLRQALQEMPELTEISQNIVFEQTAEGLDIQIVDQDGRSMFPDGAVLPYERTRKALVAITPVLARLTNKIRITGHTRSTKGEDRDYNFGWKLSAGRAIAVEEILSFNGLPQDRFESIVGRSDKTPVFPDNPSLAANQRVSITLLREAPPIPPGL